MDRRDFLGTFTKLGLAAGVSALGLVGCKGDAAQGLLGKALPAAKGVYTNGAGFDLTNIKKPTIMRFWGMWCGPCMIDMPNWLSVVRQVRASSTLADIALLTVHVGLAPQNGISLEQWVAEQEADVATPVVNDASFVIMKAIGITGTPSTLFIDEQGIIREHAWQFKNDRGVSSFLRKITALHEKI